jgi:predicted  nucleic acid-binding Zn-ribbon protein
MHEIVEKLLVLQDRDRRLAQLKAEKVRIPQEIAAKDAHLKSEAAKLESARTQLQHIEADRKKLEIDAESKRGQIAKYRTQQAQIKSNTEYQALSREIERAEHEITEIEDRELEFMEQAEQLQPAIKLEQQQLKDITAATEAEKATLKKRIETIEQEIQKLTGERAKISSEIDPDSVHRYERILRSKGDFALVNVINGNCGGCHLHLTPQQAHDARYGSEITSCINCGRILYSTGD